MRFPIVTMALADVLAIAILCAVQSIHCEAGCPYPAHLFIDVLAKVSYVKNATSIVQTRISKVFPESFEHGQRNLSCVCVHTAPHSERRFRTILASRLHLNLCNFEHSEGQVLGSDSPLRGPYRGDTSPLERMRDGMQKAFGSSRGKKVLPTL